MKEQNHNEQPTTDSRAFRSCRALGDVAVRVAGALTGLGIWLLLVPWDLSEIDPEGNRVPGGGDDAVPQQAAAFGTVFVLGVIATFLRPLRGQNFGIAAIVAWVAVWTWRVSTARVNGANFWPVAFLYFVVPAVIAGCLLLALIGRTLRNNKRYQPPPPSARDAVPPFPGW